jgi:hypothetical protein
MRILTPCINCMNLQESDVLGYCIGLLGLLLVLFVFGSHLPVIEMLFILFYSNCQRFPFPAALLNPSRGTTARTPRRQCHAILLSFLVVVSLDSSFARTLDTGFLHSCALTESGGLRCWGYNNEGQARHHTLCCTADWLLLLAFACAYVLTVLAYVCVLIKYARTPYFCAACAAGRWNEHTTKHATQH